MEETHMAIKIRLRRDTAANWTSANPVLLPGEVGVESDTLKIKIGPLSPSQGTAWNSIVDYVNVTPAEFNIDASNYLLLTDLGLANKAPKLDASKNLLVPGTSIIVEGATLDSYKTTLAVTDPTANRTITFPDKSGTVALTTDIPVLTTDNVTEGSTNKYFTNERAQDAVASALTAGAGTSIVYDDPNNTIKRSEEHTSELQSH